MTRVIVLVVLALARIAPAQAEERVAVLARMLASSSDKTRLSAVLALAKLGTQEAERPLITALRDRSPRVRAVAATALGRLGCEDAQPALGKLAREDADEDVRKAANNAAMKIARNPHPPDARRLEEAAARRAPTPVGHPTHAIEPHPDLYVTINSASDDSPGTTDKAARKLHADIVKRVLADRCRTEASVTSIADDAQRWGLEARHIDLSVTRLAAVRSGGNVEVEAELRLAISDDNGKMLSFLSGGAKVQVPAQKYDPRYLPQLRREALENAMRGMFDKLLAHLRESAGPG